jgi:hypothetical protein
MWTSPTAVESGRDSSHAIGTTGAMTYDDVRDGFNDYAQLTAECLPVSWVYDIGRTFVLRQGLHGISVAEHGDGRARHRRGLHRLGFRSVSSLGVRVWQWQVTRRLPLRAITAAPARPARGRGRHLGRRGGLGLSTQVPPVRRSLSPTKVS